MNYLDPMLDSAFSILFDPENKKMLLAFLNDLCERTEKRTFTDILTIEVNPKDPDIPPIPFSFIRILCSTTDQGHPKTAETFIELQFIDNPDLLDACQAYPMATIARQNPRKPLTPVAVVTFSTVNLFEDDDYESHYASTDMESGISTLNLIEFHFYELNKFNKTESELTTAVDRWIYFLKHPESRSLAQELEL